MGHALLVRGVVPGPLLTHPRELRPTQMQRSRRHLSPQQRLWGRPLNPASSRGRLEEERARALKDHLVPREEQAKGTEGRSELLAEGL